MDDIYSSSLGGDSSLDGAQPDQETDGGIYEGERVMALVIRCTLKG